MFSELWKKWTLDKPAAFGDLLWEVFVVQFAAWLDRLTLRKVIAFIPVVFLVLAYAHQIPIPPELMLVGDFLAYIDIFSVILLLSIFSKMTVIWLFAKQTTSKCATIVSQASAGIKYLVSSCRRESNLRGRKRSTGSTKLDGEDLFMKGLVWI